MIKCVFITVSKIKNAYDKKNKQQGSKEVYMEKTFFFDLKKIIRF